MGDIKDFFVGELKQHYQELIAGAHQAETRAATAAGEIQAEARRKEDAKGSVEFARMARGHEQRRQRARRELEQLIAFARGGLRRFSPKEAVAEGALVDVSVEDEAGAVEERTLFLLPVGAGCELKGPGGDGFVTVVTTASPLGKALAGARVGEAVEVVIAGQDREWTVVDLG